MRNVLRISYTVLGLLLLATIVGYNFGPLLGHDWIKELSLNLGTEILGIFLTVFLIDAVIRSNDEKERLRVRKVAFHQLRIPLLHQLHVLHAIYKASTPNAPEKMPSQVFELFTDSYFVQIAFLDFSKPAPVASIAPLDWNDYLRMETQKFKGSLGRTLEKYAIFLDGGTVELIEELINSKLLSFFEYLVTIRDLDRKENVQRNYNFLGGQGMVELVREYTAQFTALIDLHNRSTFVEQNIRLDPGLWRNDIEPKIGSARVSSS